MESNFQGVTRHETDELYDASPGSLENDMALHESGSQSPPESSVANETPILPKQKSTSMLYQEKSQLLATLKKSTEAIVNRRPKDECMAWA